MSCTPNEHGVFVLGAPLEAVVAIVDEIRAPAPIELDDDGQPVLDDPEDPPFELRSATTLPGGAVALVLDDVVDRDDAPFRVHLVPASLAADLGARLGVTTFAFTHRVETGGEAVEAFERGEVVGELVHGGECWVEVPAPAVSPLRRLREVVEPSPRDPGRARAFLDELARLRREALDDPPLPWSMPAPSAPLPPANPDAVDAIFGGLFGALIAVAAGGITGARVFGSESAGVLLAALAAVPGAMLGWTLVRAALARGVRTPAPR